MTETGGVLRCSCSGMRIPVATLLVLLGMVLASASSASAALPTRGGVYVGKVAGKTVKIKVSKRSRLRAKYTYDCGSSGGPVKAYTKLKVKRDGVFSGVDPAGFGPNISSLKGRFRTSKKARARFRVSICNGKGGVLTLKRVRPPA
jgi:hypothetical protein